jgi:hypothetical protein
MTNDAKCGTAPPPRSGSQPHHASRFPRSSRLARTRAPGCDLHRQARLPRDLSTHPHPRSSTLRRHGAFGIARCRGSSQGNRHQKLIQRRTSSKYSSSCPYHGCAWCSKRIALKLSNSEETWRSFLRSDAHCASCLQRVTDTRRRSARFNQHAYASRTSYAATSRQSFTRSSSCIANSSSRDPSSLSPNRPRPPRHRFLSTLLSKKQSAP